MGVGFLCYLLLSLSLSQAHCQGSPPGISSDSCDKSSRISVMNKVTTTKDWTLGIEKHSGNSYLSVVNIYVATCY